MRPLVRRYVHPQLALVGLLVAASLWSACAPGLPDPRHAEKVWAEQVRERGLDPSRVVNPVAVTEEMRQTAREVAGRQDPREQLRALQRYLFDPEQFPFDYETRGTYTAAEAFEHRRGNCVSFTNLFIALGRSVGVPLQAALIRRGNAEVEGNLVVVNTHMVAVYSDNDGSTLYDFARSRRDEILGLFLMDDLWISAIYHNNRGVEALRKERYEVASDHLTLSIRLAPEFTAAYGNLGVARRKQGRVEEALEIYNQALAVYDRDPTILNNLASLYQALGREQEARAALEAAKLKDATPFVLITRGNLELAQGNVRKALKLYRRARRSGPDLAEPHLAIARLELQQGREKAARRALENALEIEPDNEQARELEARLARYEEGR